jgi:hypothetical protein
MSSTTGARSASEGFTPEVRIRLGELIQLGQRSPAEAIPLATRFLDDHVDVLWHTLENAARESLRATASRMADGCPLLTESYYREAQHLGYELAGESDLPLVRLLAKTAAVTFLASAEAHRTATIGVDRPENRVEWLQRRVAAAHRRHQQALRSLVVVSKILRKGDRPRSAPALPRRKGQQNTADIDRPVVATLDSQVEYANTDLDPHGTTR